MAGDDITGDVRRAFVEGQAVHNGLAPRKVSKTIQGFGGSVATKGQVGCNGK
jgi:hypothetical protein